MTDGEAPDSGRLPRLSLFYPLYNEEGNVAEAARRALAILPRYADAFEVILVDDGSRDGTAAIADRLSADDPRIRVVHHPANRGYGAALRSGIAASRYEWVFYTDGDNQFDIGELGLLIPLADEHDIVSAYRIRRCDPFHRRLNEAIFNLAIRVLFGLRVRDVDCAFKLYRSSIFESMELVSNGAMIDVEILARAARRGARIAQVGVHHYPRTVGRQTGANLSVIGRAFRELFRLRASLR
jgi:glycosyltransferase involved in cell wall biosynthesis